MKNIFFLLIIIFLVVSCAYENENDLFNEISCDTLDVQFERDILPIFAYNCQSCHGGPSPSVYLSLETYDQIVERINAPGISGILNRIERNEGDILLMPQGYKLQNCEINKIKSWINQGYLNN